MIKESNQRIMLTLSKNQIKWLKEVAEKREITISKLISYMLMSDIEKLYNILNKDEDMEELIKIAKTKWLDED